MKHQQILRFFSFFMVLSTLSLCSMGAGLPDKGELLASAALQTESAVVQPILVPEVTIYELGTPAGPEVLFGGDVLLADRNPDVEGFVDMISSDTRGMFLVWESLDASNTHIYIYRSMDGGATWSYFADIVGGAPNEIHTPALAIPEISEQYLYVVYEYFNQIQVCRIDIDTYAYNFTNVDSNVLGVHFPRIVTDNVDYPSNYWLYVTYISGTLTDRQDAYIVKAARSEDEALTWTQHANLDTITQPAAPDIAWGETTVHVAWTGDEPYPGTGLDVYTCRSINLALTWEATMNLTSSASQTCYNPRVAAIQGDDTSGGEVVAAFTMEYPDDLDVWYAVSDDQGATWVSPYCLACSSASQEFLPDIDADPSYGSFHIVYWQDFNIMYSRAHRSTPTTWSTPAMVSDTAQAEWMFGQPTTAYDWISGEHGVAWPDFRTPTWAVYYDRQDWVDTLGCSFTCNPASGILPFSTQMSLTLDNLYMGQNRRMAGRINVYLANGSSISNWKAGFTTLGPGGSYATSWNQTIPALGALVGFNTFHLVAQDVTPAPYNQPPYPPAGDTDTAYCNVEGIP